MVENRFGFIALVFMFTTKRTEMKENKVLRSDNAFEKYLISMKLWEHVLVRNFFVRNFTLKIIKIRIFEARKNFS